MDLHFIFDYLIASERLGIWIAALMTLAIYSFLYKDNPIYRFAESILVGISVGYLLVTTFQTTIMPQAIDPLTFSLKNIFVPGKTGGISLFIMAALPIILGLLMFARFVPKYTWLSRVALAFYIGFGAGASIPANMQSQILKQIEATIRPFLGIHGFMPILNAILILVGLITTLFYFYSISIFPKRIPAGSARPPK